jgi:hypothetical protein
MCKPNCRVGFSIFKVLAGGYHDFNERKYFITPQSVECAIQEELAKGRTETVSQPAGQAAPTGRSEGESGEPHGYTPRQEDNDRIRELEREITDLKINNRSKDYYIELLKKDREEIHQERKQFVEQLITASHQIGTLEIKLLQIEG